MNGSILYDANCRLCRDLRRRFEKTFTSRGFAFAPLQLELKPGERPTEMRVRSADGRVFSGADAVIFLAGYVFWGLPLTWFARLPGAKRLLHRIYREIASRRACDNGTCLSPETRT